MPFTIHILRMGKCEFDRGMQQLYIYIIPVAFSPIIYFISLKLFLAKLYPKFQPRGSYKILSNHFYPLPTRKRIERKNGIKTCLAWKIYLINIYLCMKMLPGEFLSENFGCLPSMGYFNFLHCISPYRILFFRMEAVLWQLQLYLPKDNIYWTKL